MSDSEDDNIPDVQICEDLCQEFAAVTGTDTACAQFYLQDRQWDLQRSLNDFFENLSGSSTIRKVGGHKGASEVVLVVDGSRESLAAAASTIVTETLTAQAAGHRSSSGTKAPVIPEVLKLISWNIDGLEKKNLKLRTEAVCKIITEENADIVFLQEVIPVTASQIESALPRYKCLFGGEIQYFTAVLLKKDSIWYEDHSIIPFPESRMLRNLLSVKVKVGEKEVLLLTSHLESTADHVDERVNQLKTAFKMISNTSKEQTVIFGGDLNLRNKELDSIGGIPSGIQDLWISCGSRKECAYTWDMTRNDNLIFNGKFKPRGRFDRLYMRMGTKCKIVPKHFGLIGLERLLPHRCFPSDHWGLISVFDVSQ